MRLRVVFSRIVGSGADLLTSFEMTNAHTVIPSVCEESFPIVLMLIGIELHRYRTSLRLTIQIRGWYLRLERPRPRV